MARVTSSIRAGGTGEVVYEQAGVRQVSAARAADGRAVPRGAEVVILNGERGVVLVEPAEDFFEGDPLLTAAGRVDGGVGPPGGTNSEMRR